MTAKLFDALPPWRAIDALESIRLIIQVKQQLPDSVTAIAQNTTAYEQLIAEVWGKVKQDPTSSNIIDFIEYMSTASDEVWEKLYLDVLDLEELLPIHTEHMNKSVSSHKYFLQYHLLPDLLKEVGKGADAFNKFDYRVIFLYSGALWSAGNVATVMFDGMDFRDLADVFLFSGPNDSETCTGDKGCDQYAGKYLTVAQLIEGDIFPGRMQCFTNCRHMLIPVVSPLSEATKGGAGSGNWGHVGRLGKIRGSLKGGGLGAIGAKPDDDLGRIQNKPQL